MELSHREDLSRELADKALDEMYHIMVDSTVMKDSYKRKYLERCIDSIKKGEQQLSHFNLLAATKVSHFQFNFVIQYCNSALLTFFMTWSPMINV